MSKHNDGGPAFPIPGLGTNEAFHGMALRDYFAAKALVGLIANPNCGGSPTLVATDAFAIADAMLAARGGNDGR